MRSSSTAMSAKERYLRTLEPSLFRLGFLLDPLFVFRRLRAIPSVPELARRIADVGLYVAYGFQGALYQLRGRLMDAGRVWEKAAASRWKGISTAVNFFFRGGLVDLATRRAVVGFHVRAALGGLRPREAVPNPRFPADRHPPVRIHVSWNPHIACNYDCTYCWFHGRWKQFTRSNLYIPPRQWARHWAKFNARFGAAQIDFAGGEPFTYPGFVDILRAVSKENICMISTNLSWDVDRAIGALEPERVGFYASFHPEFVRDVRRFREEVVRLRRAGFYASASLVAYPPFMPRILDWIDFFMARGIYLSVQPFRGEWAGVSFPGAYSRASRRLLLECMEARHQKEYYPPDLLPPPRRDDSGFVPVVRDHLLFDKPTLGIPCNAGVAYLRLLHNGDVVRCSQGGWVGNFLHEEFEPLDEARPCPFERCTCPSEVEYIRGGPRGPSAGTVARRRPLLPAAVG